MEIVVVLVIIGILVFFGIPSFNQVLERSYEKDLIANLRVIAAAEQIYKNEYDAFWPPSGMYFVSDINQALRLNIIQNPKLQYSCTVGGSPLQWFCSGCRVVNAIMDWCVQIKNDVNNWAPYCAEGGQLRACPTCPVSGAGGCP